MIKITRDNATLPITENKNLKKHLTGGDGVYYLSDLRFSVSNLNECVKKFLNNYYVDNNTKVLLCVLPNDWYDDYLTDVSSLSHYSKEVINPEYFLTSNQRKVYVTSSNADNGFLLGFTDLNIVPEKVKVEFDDVVIESNKDLSKVEINVSGSMQIIKN